MKKRVLMLMAALTLLMVGILPAAAQEEVGDIPTVASEAGDFSTLVGALQATGLDEALAGEGPFTVFAPTDDAFAALPEGTLESLDNETLAAILQYHVVSGEYPAADVVGLDGQSVETLQGESVTISIDGETVMVNNATVVTADVMASNGVIHVIDSVLLPPSIEEAMASGEEESEMMDEEAAGDIPTVASEAGSFTTLVGALQATGLDEALAGEGPFTVFAPTDDAFAALPEGTLESLDNETLAAILQYHVVSGEYFAADVVGLDGQSVETLQGESVTISIDGETVMVNNATVVTADVDASNGVIHVIDSVLLPPSVEEALASGGAESETTDAGDDSSESSEPATMPTSGGAATTPWLPIAAAVAGLALLGGAAVLRTNER